jgi:hypothetical protein
LCAEAEAGKGSKAEQERFDEIYAAGFAQLENGGITPEWMDQDRSFFANPCGKISYCLQRSRKLAQDDIRFLKQVWVQEAQDGVFMTVPQEVRLDDIFVKVQS